LPRRTGERTKKTAERPRFLSKKKEDRVEESRKKKKAQARKRLPTAGPYEENTGTTDWGEGGKDYIITWRTEKRDARFLLRDAKRYESRPF